VKVRKHSGLLTDFDKGKIVKTCMNAGCSLELATDVASKIEAEGYESMPTEEIRGKVYDLLAVEDKELAEKYLYRTN